MKYLSKTVRAARIISYVLVFITLFWAWLGVFTFFNRIYLLRNKNGFRKTQFIVESVEYHPDIGGENSDESYWANSTIDGSKEQLSLKGLLKKKGGTGSKIVRSCKRKFLPNLQKIRAIIGKHIKKIYICTKCLKKGNIIKA